MEKYLFGLGGIILGALLAFAKELFVEQRSRKREAEYLAIRVVCILDSFLDGCADVVNDDGLYHGQSDKDGYSRVQVQSPTLNLDLEDVNWKSLPSDLMYEILTFPNLIAEANSFINSTFEYAANPPDFSEGFEERQFQYSALGKKAAALSNKIRESYKIPNRQLSSWDVVEYVNTEFNKISAIRAKRQVEFNAVTNG